MMALHPTRRAGEKGMTLVESCLVLMLFFFLLIGIVECGRVLNSYHFLSNASREAVRYAMVRGADSGRAVSAANVTSYVKSIAPGICEDLVDSTDFLPTILEASGRPMREHDLSDGLSFFGQLIGKEGPKRKWTFCHYDPRPGWDKDKFGLVRYARTKRYKLYGNGRMYDVANDRLETRPILPDDDTEASKQARATLKEVLESMPLNSAN